MVTHCGLVMLLLLVDAETNENAVSNGSRTDSDIMVEGMGVGCLRWSDQVLSKFSGMLGK